VWWPFRTPSAWSPISVPHMGCTSRNEGRWPTTSDNSSEALYKAGVPERFLWLALSTPPAPVTLSRSCT